MANGSIGNEWYDDQGPMGGVYGRVLDLELKEALALGCSDIQIDVGEDRCSVHFMRGSEKLARDPFPKRLFRPFSNHVASMCGKLDCEGHGIFSASLQRDENPAEGFGQVKVSVVLGNLSLRLTITDFQKSVA